MEVSPNFVWVLDSLDASLSMTLNLGLRPLDDNRS